MLNKTRKGLSGIALATLIFAGSFSGFYRGSEVHAEEDYHSWSQMDKRWADIPIGYSTMAKSGCLVTSIAIMAVNSGSADPETFNPGVFAEAINGINGFNSYGAISSWSAVSAVIPDVEIKGTGYFSSYSEGGKAEEIKSIMEQGCYVICNVGNHWVFVEDVIGDDVYMIDPAKDDVLMFDSYSNYNISQYNVLTGKNPPSLSADSNDISETVTTTFISDTTEVTTTAPTTTETTTSTTTTAETTTSTTTTTETTTSTTTTTETTTSTTTTTETTTSTTTTTETTTSTTTTTETTTSTTTTTETTTSTTNTTETTSSEQVKDEESASQTETGISAEFYYSGEGTTSVTTENGDIIAELENGHIVDVKKIENGKGLVMIDGVDGWVDMAEMNLAESFTVSIKGDINRDGEINIYDVSLINEYLTSLKFLPEGVSVLSRSEIETADINGDGVVDNEDVIEYLSLMFN